MKIHSLLLDKARQRLLLTLVTIAIIQSLCLIGMIYQAKQSLQASNFTPSFYWLGFAFFGILVIATGRYCERYIAEQLAQEYVNELRQSVFLKVLQLPISASSMINKGGTLLRLTGDMAAIRNWIVSGLVPAIVLGIWLLIALIGLSRINPLLTASLIPLIVIIFIGNYLIGKNLYDRSKLVRRTRGRLIRNVTEQLREIRIIKSFNQISRERKRFNEQSRLLSTGNIKRASISGISRGFNEAVLGTGVLALFITGLWLVKQQEIKSEDVAIVMTAALYFLSHLRPLSRLYELWTLKKLATHKLEYFFNRKENISVGTKKRPSKILTIQLDKLQSNQRFPPISAELTGSDRIRLYGQTGGGKSSLLCILAGLLDYSNGEMKVNSIELSKFQPFVISQLTTLISQQMPLLRGTIRKNLFYGARQKSDSYTRNVLSLCNLEPWLTQQPNGMDTRLQENGSNLSASQNYKIMLARALLRRPKVLLIDTDAAHHDDEIKIIILKLLKTFEGAIIICSEHGFSYQYYNQIWELNTESFRITHLPNEPNSTATRPQ